MSVKLNNSMEDEGSFVKCLTKYKNESQNKLKLRDAVTRAYNKKYNTKLKPGEIIPLLKKQDKLQPFEPYQWQKKFLDEFEEAPRPTNGKKEKHISSEDEDDEDENEDEIMDIQEPENSVPVNGISNGISVSGESSSNTMISVECKPDIPDYKTMSVYELKRALLVSKLEILDAQEAIERAKGSIRLNKVEHLKRGIRGMK